MLTTRRLIRTGRVSSAAVIALACLGGCQSRTTDVSAFRVEIDKLRSAYEAAVASGDVSAMTPLLADGAVMVQPGAPDWNAMRAVAGGAPFAPGAKIAIRPIELVQLSGEWAYEFGTSTTTYTPAGAGEPVTLRDTYLILFRKTSEGWKAYREVASAAPPPGGWPEER